MSQSFIVPFCVDKNEPKKPPADESLSAATVGTRDNFKGPSRSPIASYILTGVKLSTSRTSLCLFPPMIQRPGLVNLLSQVFGEEAKVVTKKEKTDTEWIKTLNN